MTEMDKALPKLLAFPPQPPPANGLEEAEYDQRIREVIKTLNTIPANKFAQPVDGKTGLETFDPAVQSLPYLYALSAQIASEKAKEGLKPNSPTWKSIEDFVKQFDPVQMRYSGFQWRALVEELLSVAQNVEDTSQAAKALELAQMAFLRLDPSTSTFTSVHLDLVKTALARRRFSECLKVLDNDIYHFPVKSESNKHISRPSGKHISSSTYITTASGFSRELTYRDHLQYFLYGGMVYIGLENWSRALLFLELGIVAPITGSTVSMIQVEAYKKWLLVSILRNGHASTTPRSISPQISKLYTGLSKPYLAIAEAFKERAPGKLLGEYKAGIEDEIWQNDRNHSLVKLVVASHRRSQILSFSKVYASIPLTTLSRLISEQQEPTPEDPSEVEKDIRAVLASKSIDATLVSGKDGAGELLKFLSPDGRVPLTDGQQATRLHAAVAKIHTLNIHVKDAQRRLELTKEYVLAAKKKRGKGTEGAHGDGDDLAISMPGGIEEDMLADL